MLIPPACLLIAALGQSAPATEPEHAANQIYRDLLRDGLPLAGGVVRFPVPRLRDGQSADSQRAALMDLAGSKGKADDLLRDSVVAPFLLKVRDLKPDGTTLIRGGDLWFVVHADLSEIDPDQMGGLGKEGEAVEVGNMRFQGRTVEAAELQRDGIEPPVPTGGEGGSSVRFVHLTGRLLDRIGLEATSRVEVTRSADSIVIASRSLTDLAPARPLASRWWPITTGSGGEGRGEPRPYAGGASTVKISRLRSEPGALLVEVHFVYDEPLDWFDGAPILRSKIGLAAQDQIRRLRRELAARARPSGT